MKKILLASDFSESCQNSLQYVMSLTEGKDIKIDLIHVYDMPASTIAHLPAYAVSNFLEKKKDSVIEQLNQLRNQLPVNQKGDIHAVYGVYPSSEIVHHAQKNNADLIVVALRQKYSLIDRMIGTVTAHTIEKSKIPVLAIPNGAQYEPIERILFPTTILDAGALSDKEEAALDWLCDFWGDCNQPEIEMVHINQGNNDGNSVDVQHSHQLLPDMKFIVSESKKVDEGILKVMEKEAVNLLAFYKPNRTFWERLYHSSVTRKLLFQSRLPLLVFL